MTVTRGTLIVSAVCLLLCHVVVAQETVDMSAWRDENPKMGSCECEGQRSKSLNEKHLQKIRAIIKDVREIYTDCSSQTDKVNNLRSQNKYLLTKVEHLEGDITVLDKELRVLLRMRQDMPRDLPGDLNDVTDGASGECERPLSFGNEVSQSPAAKISLEDLSQVMFLNRTVESLESRILLLEKLNSNRRRKLRLLTKKNVQQGAALKRMQRNLVRHVTKSRTTYEKHKLEKEALEARFDALSKVVRKLERSMAGLTDRQKGVNRKYRLVMRSITRMADTPSVDTSVDTSAVDTS